jgi:hypothetical protein
MQSTGRRQTTTVPTQALAMMNSPLVRQAAERLARRARQEAGGASADAGPAIGQTYRIAFGRPPTDAERDQMAAFIHDQADGYVADAKADRNKAADQAFAAFCQLLLCSSEFVYVD